MILADLETTRVHIAQSIGQANKGMPRTPQVSMYYLKKQQAAPHRQHP